MADEPHALSPVAELVGSALERLVRRGRRTVGRAAEASRSRLELRQLQRDRDAFWVRLGKTAYHLVQDGEIEDHPTLRKAIDRIDALERQSAAMQSDEADQNT